MCSTNWFNYYGVNNFIKYIQDIEKLNDDIIKEEFLERIFHCFQIDLLQWSEIEFILVFKGRLSISDIDNLEYYRVQMFIKNYEKYLDEERKHREKEEASTNGKVPIFNQRDLMSQSNKLIQNNSNMIPKIPTLK
jgi:hypothetical protein